MFTGIIRILATVVALEKTQGKTVLKVAGPFNNPEVDESIAINGCCLTVVAAEKSENKAEGNPHWLLSFDVLPETISKTALNDLKIGEEVNAEESLTYGTSKVGGHMLQGHVDVTATLTNITPEGDSFIYTFDLAAPFVNMLLPKCFIALDGISLTVTAVTKTHFSVMIIPHTRKYTVAKNWSVGSLINVEVDILNKSIYSYMQHFKQQELQKK